VKAATVIATCCGIGHLRPAPGTWASAVAVVAGLVIDRYAGFPALAAATVAAVLLGFWAVPQAVAGQADKDPGHIVIDEVAGQWIALLFPAAAFWLRGWEGWLPWPAPVAAFLLFRLFDIWKPGPVGRADRRADAPGVIIDDIWAGVFAGIATIVAAALYHIPMAA
jgi:phosphatidylglycerophosphatase A